MCHYRSLQSCELLHIEALMLVATLPGPVFACRAVRKHKAGRPERQGRSTGAPVSKLWLATEQLLAVAA